MYDSFSGIYDKLMKYQVNYDFIFENIYNICIRNNLKPKTVLECAMGSGNMSEKFLENGLSVDGFDISDNMLSLAYNKLLKYDKVRIFKGDVVNFNTGKKYDLICCF